MNEWNEHQIIQDQIVYYRARASEYDEWFYRQGRFDRGTELNQRWFNEIAQVRSALQQVGNADRILELACGTGIWTQELLTIGNQITAIDASAEVLESNRHKLGASSQVVYQQRDLGSAIQVMMHCSDGCNTRWHQCDAPTILRRIRFFGLGATPVASRSD